MKLASLLPAVLATLCASALVFQASSADAFVLTGSNLPLTQRHFRVFNNFSDPSANDNVALDPQFPRVFGAPLAIWKGAAEWGSRLHGTGAGDPTQPGDLGSGGANFDTSFQGLATSVGSTSSNTFSEIPGASGGLLYFIETGPAGGYRVRFYSSWTWDDGPGIPPGSNIDLQGITCRIFGQLLGLGNSNVQGATMYGVLIGSVTDLRSIEADDIAGVQAIYGVASPTKPVISGTVLTGDQLQVMGSNFAPTGNSIWFTAGTGGGAGVPVQVNNLNSNGSLILATVPQAAGSGDILVKTSGPSFDDLSNAWPLDLEGLNCPAPQVYCTSLPNSTGSAASISWNGVASLTVNNFQLLASSAPANKNGLFFFGPDGLSLPFGNGIRCVGGSLTRLPVLTTNGVGAALQNIDLNAPPFSAVAGQALRFQFWFRDPGAGGAGFNTSSAFLVTVCP